MNFNKLIDDLEERNKLLTEVNPSYMNKVMCQGYQMALNDLRAYFNTENTVTPIEPLNYDSEGNYIER